MSDEIAPDSPKAPLATPPRRRVKTPTVLQMEAVECGAAALSIVLSHLGLWLSLEELRHECGVSRDGSKASNVLKAARKYGLDAKGFKYESVEKLYDLPFPVILFWNLNHFVVLEGFDRQRVFINDPAQGPRELTLQELDVAYSGIVLTFKPGPDFKKGGNAPDMLPALRRRLVGSEKALAFTIVCGLFLVVPGLVVPTFTRLFIDSYLVAGQAWLIRPLLLAMGLTIVIQGALTWLQKYYLLRLETKLALSTSSNFFRHILRLPAAYFGQRFAGEIGSRVLINDKVARIVSGKLATTAIDLAMTVFYAALMMFYSVSMTFAVIAIAALNAAAIKL
ncbi:MAG: cysteine peptidase family C39 domain-containing protein, partial [Acidobacteriota bacterium]